MADRYRYRIDLAADSPEELRDVLEQIGEDGRQVVKIIWQPRRTVTASGEQFLNSGYVVISEKDCTSRS